MEVMGYEITDEMLSVIVPIIVYWVFSGIYGLLGYLENQRLHPKEEEEKKNIADKWTVFKGVLNQQAVQTAVVFAIVKLSGGSGEAAPPQPPLLVQVRQFLVAMVVLDTWQYFGHRYMHENKFLYKHIHSIHHNLVVPYAYGALFNNPIEGLILDTIGGSLAFLLSGMTPRTSILFFSFATVKAVDMHSGLFLPWNPLQFLFVNNVAYHDVHHNHKGFKYNYAQPFFMAWDKILGTHMPFEVVKREGGGYQVMATKDV